MQDPDKAAVTEPKFLEYLRRQQQETARKTTVVFEDRVVYALYLDMDGFRNRLDTDPAKLYSDFRDLKRFAVDASIIVGGQSDGSGKMKLNGPENVLMPYVFSDSWFVVTEDDSSQALRELCHVAAIIFGKAMVLGFPSHGAIAKGRCWWNPPEQIILGPAIRDAYQLGEALDCYGIALDDSVATTEASTAALRVPCKRQPPRTLRFARLPDDREYAWRKHFDECRNLAATLIHDEEKRIRILERYRVSEAIAGAMLD